ncbi:hypothetical protein PENTCL1PPCAC_17325, partial [Pristionchus entomophagus]
GGGGGGGGTAVRQRLVIPRMYSTVSSSSLSSFPSSSGRPIVSLASTSNATSTTGFNTQPVYYGVRQPQGPVNNGAVSRTIRFRPAAPGAPPILHNGVGGAGNVRMVDSRRMRSVYVRTPSSAMTTTTTSTQSMGGGVNRVNAAANGMNGGMKNGVNGVRRVAYISPPTRTTRVVVPKVGGSGGVTMAAGQEAAAAHAAATTAAASNEPPVLIPEKPVMQETL